MRSHTLIAGVIILVFCGVLAVTDFVLLEQPRIIAISEETTTPPNTVSMSSSSSSSSSTTPSEVMMNSSSAPNVVKKGVSTKKAQNMNIDDILAQLQLIIEKTNETSFMMLIAPEKSSVQTVVLLRNNDRAFLLSWMEHDNVKAVFASLKQALQEQFSGKVTNLIDETRTPANKPPVDYLSFTDPALSSERIVFLRIRTRLYELHIAKNGEDLLEQLVAELSK